MRRAWAPPSTSSNQTFQGDSSEWIIPGDYETGFSTVKYCYQAGQLPVSNLQQFAHWKRITFLATNYSRDMFLFGYGYGGVTNNSVIWKIQFQSCSLHIDVVAYFDLAEHKIPLNEQVVAISADDATGKAVPNYVVTNTSVYVLAKNGTYLPNPLPSSDNSSDVYPLITGVFTIGLDQMANDNLYIGRGRSDPRLPGQLVIYSTDDFNTFFHYNRTVELFAAPLNLQIQGFIGSPQCRFLAHRALPDAAIHLVNECYGDIVQNDTKYVSYNTSDCDYVSYWPTPDPTVLILTASETPNSISTELFVFDPHYAESLVLNVSNYHPPNIVYVSTDPTTCGSSSLSSCIVYFTHDSSNNAAQLILDVGYEPAPMDSVRDVDVDVNVGVNDYLGDGSAVEVIATLEVKTLESQDVSKYLDSPYFVSQPCCAGKNDTCLCLQPNEYCKEYHTPIGQNVTTFYLCVSCSCDPSQCNQTTNSTDPLFLQYDDDEDNDCSLFAGTEI